MSGPTNQIIKEWFAVFGREAVYELVRQQLSKYTDSELMANPEGGNSVRP